MMIIPIPRGSVRQVYRYEIRESKTPVHDSILIEISVGELGADAFFDRLRG